ncbi:HAD domain-containing protein [Streptomyces sp. NBC_01485]|uniref:HAD domain-containing protein n=1 Tax=Streptomyces sp. NBC_01485 TaxID=2903884 RepID=UPI002E37E569|nr:HAD domain-containing protein [Streptomyces sp. NBC_01485]
MLLYLDVDGTLIPFGGTAPHPEYGEPSPEHPLLSRLDPSLGPQLLSLGCELVWATTWLDDANTVLTPRLGLPTLPVVQWPEDEDEGADAEPGLGPGGGGVHWKTRPLVARAAGRPFVWLDDEITDADRVWTAVHHPGAALLHRVHPARGLTDADFVIVEEWIRGQRGA